MLDTETRTVEYTDSPEREDERPEPRVLWGRFVFWGVLLLFTFLIGRWSAPNGVPSSQLAELDQQITELSQRNQELENLLEAQQAASASGPAEPDEDAAAGTDIDPAADAADPGDPGDPAAGADASIDDAAGDAAADAPPGSRSYTVQEGDTLNGIAERMYGDGTKSSLIMQANGVDRETPLHIGQELVLPPAD